MSKVSIEQIRTLVDRIEKEADEIDCRIEELGLKNLDQKIIDEVRPAFEEAINQYRRRQKENEK